MSKSDRILIITFYLFCFVFIILGLSYLCIINKFIGLICWFGSVYLYLAFTSIPYEHKHKLIIDETKDQTTMLILGIHYLDYMKLPIEERIKLLKYLNNNIEK